MSEGRFEQVYRRSMDDPEGFWAEAAEGIHWTKQWDRVLDDEMVAEDGNAFLQAYVGGPVDQYSRDDAETLKGGLPSELHAPYTEANHQAMRVVIDRRYAAWRETGMAGRQGT